MQYQEIVERRRGLRIDGYKTFADVGFDGPWVTPYQIASRSPDGPVLVGYNWFDVESFEKNRAILTQLGFMPGIPFNRVLEKALAICGMARKDIYVTQAFHLLHPTERSGNIRNRDIDTSFKQVTRHELVGRFVIALGDDAAGACERHGVRCAAVCHPSGRGLGKTDEYKATQLANALIAWRKVTP